MDRDWGKGLSELYTRVSNARFCFIGIGSGGGMLMGKGRYLGLDIALKEVEASTKYEVSLGLTCTRHLPFPLHEYPSR